MGGTFQLSLLIVCCGSILSGPDHTRGESLVGMAFDILLELLTSWQEEERRGITISIARSPLLTHDTLHATAIHPQIAMQGWCTLPTYKPIYLMLRTGVKAIKAYYH